MSIIYSKWNVINIRPDCCGNCVNWYVAPVEFVEEERASDEGDEELFTLVEEFGIYPP